MAEACFLSKNGIGDLEDVLQLDRGERFGLAVILSRFDGVDFDFDTGKWKKKS